ncbi:MAG: hypothetical protein IPK83_07205 [Planctomycetes bacterium]|nr:hypothetical protein [Planctomycetota bacterium]
MDKLVLYRLTSGPANAPPNYAYPAFGFIAETWLWLALIGVGIVVGRWVDSWFTPVPSHAPLQPPTDPATDIKQGAGTVALSVAIAWILLSYLVGTDAYPIDKGQVYFGIASAFLIAGLISHWLFQMKTFVWMLVVVAIVATGAYVYSGPGGEILEAARKTGAHVPLEPLARPLPIEYAALGAIGVLLERDMMVLLAAMFGIQPSEVNKP